MRYRLRTLLNWLFNKPAKFDPAEANRKWSAATQSAAERKLGRSLNADEEYKIWNCGSFMRLEQIDMAIQYAASPADLESYIASLPKPDPIPEAYTRR